MTLPISHPQEEQRLESLYELGLLDTPAEERFDRITRLVQRHFGVPIVLLTLIDEDRQWVKSSQGMSIRENPRGKTFCGHTILGTDVLHIVDALEEPKFRQLVGPLKIRFYAGCPLFSPGGLPVGSLCILDFVPRELNPEQKQSLRDFAAIVESEFRVDRMNSVHRELLVEVDRLQHKALVDPLTRCWNRAAIMDILERETARATRDKVPLALSMLDLDHFKKVNDEHGHLIGDIVLKEVAERIRRQVRNYDSLGRYGGEEFLLVLPGCELDTATTQAERVREGVRGKPIRAEGVEISITASLGVTLWASDDTVETALARADRALYRAKQDGRDRVHSL